MSNYAIFRNVAKPAVKKGAKSKYPWNEIGVGEMFVVDDMTVKSFRPSCYAASKRSEKTFSCVAGPLESEGREICGANSVAVFRDA